MVDSPVAMFEKINKKLKHLEVVIENDDGDFSAMFNVLKKISASCSGYHMPLNDCVLFVSQNPTPKEISKWTLQHIGVKLKLYESRTLQQYVTLCKFCKRFDPNNGKLLIPPPANTHHHQEWLLRLKKLLESKRETEKNGGAGANVKCAPSQSVPSSRRPSFEGSQDLPRSRVSSPISRHDDLSKKLKRLESRSVPSSRRNSFEPDEAFRGVSGVKSLSTSPDSSPLPDQRRTARRAKLEPIDALSPLRDTHRRATTSSSSRAKTSSGRRDRSISAPASPHLVRSLMEQMHATPCTPVLSPLETTPDPTPRRSEDPSEGSPRHLPPISPEAKTVPQRAPKLLALVEEATNKARLDEKHRKENALIKKEVFRILNV